MQTSYLSARPGWPRRCGVKAARASFCTTIPSPTLTISPGLIETDMIAGNPRARADLLPVGRFGHPEEVAEVAVLLAVNGYMMGQNIQVNGGWYMA